MPSVTRPDGASALADRIAVLEAERLAPVPRASRAIAVDAADLALVLDLLRAPGQRNTKQLAGISADTAAAWQRLEQAARQYTAPGAAQAERGQR